MSDPQAYFATPGAITDGGRHTAMLASLPSDVPTLAEIVQGLVIHEHLAAFYDVTVTDTSRESVNVRPVAQLVDEMLTLDDRPLSEPRAPGNRVMGNCRHFSVLLVAMLRAQGTPARARCGFGGYFVDRRFEDHWVAEHWDADEARWRLVDAQLDGPQRDAFGIDFDVTDVPRDRFLVAGDAWTKCRDGVADPGTFGLTMLDEAGDWWVAQNLLRDVAALNKVELLPWDIWGAMHEPDDPIPAEDRGLFDRLAALTHEPDRVLGELHEIASTDERVRVPPTVRNLQHGADEPVPV